MRRAALLVLAAAACVAALVLVRAWRFRPDPRTAGVLDVELEVAGEGGHSSMPPPRTAIGILAAAVKRVEDHPLPSRPTSLWRLLDVVGREMPFGSRLAVANRWLFGPLVERALARIPSANAGLRTTTAVTMIEGGVKPNVLPARARAVVNFRLMPGDTAAGVLEQVRRVVDDPRVDVRQAGSREASRESRSSGAAWARVRAAALRAFPEAVVAPALVLGGTDSRHLQDVSDDTYRFLPVVVGPDDLPRVHGKDERVAVAALGAAVAFYLEYPARNGPVTRRPAPDDEGAAILSPTASAAGRDRGAPARAGAPRARSRG